MARTIVRRLLNEAGNTLGNWWRGLITHLTTLFGWQRAGECAAGRAMFVRMTAPLPFVRLCGQRAVLSLNLTLSVTSMFTSILHIWSLPEVIIEPFTGHACELL